MQKVTIIGAGLAGCMLAIYLAKLGYQVDIFEKRSDIRKLPQDYGRSINLALSYRGIKTLKEVGLYHDVMCLAVPMHSRAVHDSQGNITYQAFGRHKQEYINAIKRTDLSMVLINHLESFANVNFYFNTHITQIDFARKQFFYKNAEKLLKYNYHLLIGADGAGSMVREQLTQLDLVKSKRQWMAHGYKELSIPTKYGIHWDFKYLHLWPRKSFMMLGNPNRDHSITATLFLNNQGTNSFQSIQDDKDVEVFFKQHFPDAYACMPDLLQEFSNNPIGGISTVTCEPWYYKDQCLLIGDAAHGIVPFFGQGMNCAFEDCRILHNELLKNNHNWDKSMQSFYAKRKINTDAIAQMSMENYKEIEHDLCHPEFKARKHLEQELMQRYEAIYQSKHIMVMFSSKPYAYIHQLSALQNNLLDEIQKLNSNSNRLDWGRVDNILTQYDKKMASMRINDENI